MTADRAQCLAKESDAPDAQLNAVYQSVRGKLDAAEVQQLITADRVWIQYPDAYRSAERDLYGGGTATGPAHLACLDDAGAYQGTEGHECSQAQVAALMFFPVSAYIDRNRALITNDDYAAKGITAGLPAPAPFGHSIRMLSGPGVRKRRSSPVHQPREPVLRAMLLETFEHPNLKRPLRDRGESALTIRMNAQFTQASG